MASSSSPLSQNDLDRLSRDSGPEIRAMTAQKIARLFAQNQLPDRERALAADILRRFSADPDVQVRRILASDLKDIPLVPHDIAVSLAGDVAEVAAPILSASQALTDADLLLAIDRGSAACHQAIASRPELSKTVTRVLVECCDRRTVTVLLGNADAPMDSELIAVVWRRFAKDRIVLHALSRRRNMPAPMVMALIPDLSAPDRDHVIVHQTLPDGAPTPLIDESRNRLCQDYRMAGYDDREGFAHAFHRAKRLNPLVAMRALCLGDHHFFETALGLSVGLGSRNASILMHGGDGKGLREIYGAARMPDKWFPFATAAVNTIQYLGGPNRSFHRDQFRDRLIDRLLPSLQRRADADVLSYLLSPERGA